MQASTPEQLDEILRQLPPQEQRAFLLEQPGADVEAWGKWKESKGEVSYTKQENAPDPLGTTNVRLGAGAEPSPPIPPEVPPMVEQAQPPAANASPEERENWLTRSLDIGGRAVVNGVAGIPLALMDMLPYVNASQAVNDGMTDIGMAKPESSMEKILSAMVEGASGGASGLARGLVTGIGKRSLSEGVKSIGKGTAGEIVSGALGSGAGAIAAENGAGTGGQIMAALGAGLSPQAFQGIMKQQMMKGTDPAKIDAILEAFETAGTTPSVGQLTGGPRTNKLEATLSQFFGSSNKMQNFLQGQEKAVGGMVKGKADDILPDVYNTPEQVGRGMVKNYEDITVPQNRAIRQDLQEAIAKEIPGDPTMNVDQYKDIVTELAKGTPGINNQMDSALLGKRVSGYKDLQQNLQKDLKESMDMQAKAGIDPEAVVRGLPWLATRKLKSAFGARLDDSVTKNIDVPAAELKRLSGALSEDVKNMVKQYGPGAEEAFAAMNKWEIQHAADAEILRGILDKSGGYEKVFQAALNSAKSGPTVINTVMNSLPEGAQRMLTAGIMKDMGRSANSNADDFDLQTFFTKFKAMKSDDKTIQSVFAPMGPDFVKDMNKIYDAAKTILQQRKDFGIAARGNKNLGIQGLLYAFGGPAIVAALKDGSTMTTALAGVAGLGTLVGGSNMLAGYLTNPKTVKWLASNSKLPDSAWPTAINLLAQEARQSGDPDLQELAATLQEVEAAKSDKLTTQDGTEVMPYYDAADPARGQ